MKNALRFVTSLALGLSLAPFFADAQAPDLEMKPADPFFAKFNPVKAPVSTGLLLKKGDRLAICGDSITEQHTYSRILETYLTVCVPELNVSVRQFGWSGETAEGFLGRMTNDCLRFKPTVATTCYGMNDHRYKGPNPENAAWYRKNYDGIIKSFKANCTRVVIGSPSPIGSMPPWARNGKATVEDMNLSLCDLRNIDIDIAAEENIRFADIFWPMFTAGFEGKQKFSQDYALSGKDGVHPGMAGAVFMAKAFMKSLGFDGNIGTFTVDLQKNSVTATSGHKVDHYENGTITLTSRRYPYCASDDPAKDDSVRSGMALSGFNQEFNRLILVVKYATAPNYKVTWGTESRTYSGDQLASGVNLADDFAKNPFSEAFAKVEAAILAKQNYETRQVKTLFHGEEGRFDMNKTAAFTEKVHKSYVDAIKPNFVPVTHTIKIEEEK